MCIRDSGNTDYILADLLRRGCGIGRIIRPCRLVFNRPSAVGAVSYTHLDVYKRQHQPLTDFWRVGRGIAKKLEQNGMFTMGDVALCSERNEDLLYKLFGKNAELLIDLSLIHISLQRLSSQRRYAHKNYECLRLSFQDRHIEAARSQ